MSDQSIAQIKREIADRPTIVHSIRPEHLFSLPTHSLNYIVYVFMTYTRIFLQGVYDPVVCDMGRLNRRALRVAEVLDEGDFHFSYCPLSLSRRDTSNVQSRYMDNSPQHLTTPYRSYMQFTFPLKKNNQIL